jgi:hypothetical protein
MKRNEYMRKEKTTMDYVDASLKPQSDAGAQQNSGGGLRQARTHEMKPSQFGVAR